MSYEFELLRVSDSISKIKRDLDELKFSIQRSERDELAEIERVRRDFSMRRSAMENKEAALLSEIKAATQKQKDLQLLVTQEKQREADEKRLALEEEKKRRLHL